MLLDTQYNLNYSISAGSCSDAKSKTTFIYPKNPVSFNGLKLEYCENSATEKINVSTFGGFISGEGIALFDDQGLPINNNVSISQVNNFILLFLKIKIRIQ